MPVAAGHGAVAGLLCGALGPRPPGSAWVIRPGAIPPCCDASRRRATPSACTASRTDAPSRWTGPSGAARCGMGRPCWRTSRVAPWWVTGPRSGACAARPRSGGRNSRNSASATTRAAYPSPSSGIRRLPGAPTGWPKVCGSCHLRCSGPGRVRMPLWGWGLRVLPFGLVRRALEALALEDAGTPLVLHPWELDAAQPRLTGISLGHRVHPQHRAAWV